MSGIPILSAGGMRPNTFDATQLLALRAKSPGPFAPLDFEVPPLAWPTKNRALFAEPASYIARTRVNPDYGKPGWTRDCGRRFHRGLDIAPVTARPRGDTVTVLFSDCATGREYPSEEPAWVPEDDVFAVSDGFVLGAESRPDVSDLGCWVLLVHDGAGIRFFTLYAHLADVAVAPGAQVSAGQQLGPMGQTSRSDDARAWMAIAPHLHFEVLNANAESVDPLEFLRAGLRRRTGEQTS